MKKYIALITLCAVVLTGLGGCKAKKTSGDDFNLDYYKDMAGLDGSGVTLPEEEVADREFGEGEFNVINPEGNQTQQPSGSQPSGSQPSGSQPSGNGGSSQKQPQQIDPDRLITADTVIENAYDFETDERPNYEGAAEYDDTPSNKELEYHKWVDANIGDVKISEDQFDLDKLDLPRIYINTLDGKNITSRTEYVSATLSIDNCEAKYCMNDRQVEIRGRGNSTWMYEDQMPFDDKKPYKIKFNTKVDLFGFGGNKKYVLLANVYDEVNIRTYLAFYLAEKFGIEYASDYKMVNVILNGKYKGMYTLCEQVSEGEARVDVKTSKSGEVDTGYIVESINSSENDGYVTFKLPEVDGRHLGHTGRHNFIVKSPGKDITGPQLAFIQDYVKQVNEAIFKKDWKQIQKLCDVDSFVNMTLVNAIMMNNDYGYSFYMYKKKGGKLHLGPVWDFDQSSGSSTHGGTTYRGWFAGTEPDWQTALLEIPEFQELVAKRYKEMHKVVKGIPEFMEKTINDYEFDFAMNNLARNNEFKNRWRMPTSIQNLGTYKKHASALKTWFLNRIMWLDDQCGVK